MNRRAAVAGYFYPREPEALRAQLSRLLVPGRERRKAMAVVVPHAGYDFSGAVAGAVFSSVEIPAAFILLGISHRPIRSLFAIMSEGVWETPLGEVPVDAPLAEALLSRSELIRTDPGAHEAEHSLEVQLPFLQIQQPAPRIVPLAVSGLARYEDLEALGQAVAGAVRDAGRDVLIVASTDMSHYVRADEARFKDFLAIQTILELAPRRLYDVVRGEAISMCGFQPTTAALVAARELGAAKADLVMYATSGDRTGDLSEVVGYAGLSIV